MLIYNPYAPLNHTFHFIHQMLMVLQTPTLPSGSHSGTRNSESEAGNCWELAGGNNTQWSSRTLTFFILGGAMPHHLWNLGSPARDRTHSLALEARSVNHWIARKVPLTSELGSSGVSGKDWV